MSEQFSPYKSLPKWLLTPGKTKMHPISQTIFTYYATYHDACTKKLENILDDLNMSEKVFYKYRKMLVDDQWLESKQRVSESGRKITSETRVNWNRVAQMDIEHATIHLKENQPNQQDNRSYKKEEVISTQKEEVISTQKEDHSNKGFSNKENSNYLAQNVPDLEPLSPHWSKQADSYDSMRNNPKLFKTLRALLKPTKTLQSRFPEFVQAHPTATAEDVACWIEREWPRHKFFDEEKPPIGTLINDFKVSCSQSADSEKYVMDWLSGKKPLKDLPTSLQISIKELKIQKTGLLESEAPAVAKKVIRHAKQRT